MDRSKQKPLLVKIIFNQNQLSSPHNQTRASKRV